MQENKEKGLNSTPYSEELNCRSDRKERGGMEEHTHEDWFKRDQELRILRIENEELKIKLHQ